ncbi:MULTISPECIES: response regulator [Streptomyces]|jgi:DNA-binding NarL/FixJ family response regulator|uniref:Response regulator transcription factor n=2 Tax=Streptomyces TaxID=1883 RepID=A0ABU3J0M3_9ACTN|nr:response regulator transcription factor [Streptomyces sp. McG7]MBT2905327.1 response regulator transcription factor [Streptomyces sp. McG8]MDQ0487411.1 DNA-binding NarL/FixJ family response regulator [Streptomyces thermodiastaticus]MDT6968612.1 response regulator transcription factor [Streptomyces thermocarboxydus]MDX3416037.1 response regulator transcription factor [Streptomyces sp. MD20-1-1]MXQ58899.1 response regulator [Streptomyces sp. XHT-2]MYQ32770.1 response regulator [Streptomyces 
MTGNDRPIRVAVVDDQPLIRAGFSMVLAGQDDIEVVGEAENGQQALDLLDTVDADVVIMDVRMPVMDGIQATERLMRRENPPGVLVLTTFDDDEDAFAALRAGAGGFLLKNAPADQVVHAIRVLAAGESVVAPRITRLLLDRVSDRLAPANGQSERLDLLTGRERDVLGLVARGLSNAEIAAELYVAEATVKTHLGNLMAKLHLRDRAQAVVFAYESGLVRPSSP